MLNSSEGRNVDLDIILSGSFEDKGYIVNTAVIRLNNTGVVRWIKTHQPNPFKTYDTMEEREAHEKEIENKKYELEREVFEKVIEKLGIAPNEESLSVTRNVSEIFTVVWMTALPTYYFTFGSDPKYPYQNTYLIVKAKDKHEAIRKFRARHKDREEGGNVYNAAFCYNEREWEDDVKKYYPEEPAEVIE